MLGDRYRDLIVIDPEIVAGALSASDAADAPFSFRAQMQWLAGVSREPLDFTRSWLSAWENISEVGAELAPVRPRPLLRRMLVDPWLAASGVEPSPSGSAAGAGYGDGTGDAASDAPYTPAGADPYVAAGDDPTPAEPAPDYSEPGELAPAGPAPGYSASGLPLPSWEHAPFRLIAIVNRVDLATRACEGYAGELRFVYAAVDAESSKLLDLTLILEVPYPSTRTAAEWARSWRDLAALPSGAAYTAGLVALVREIQAEADPLRARLRTNEGAFSDLAERA